MDREDIALVGDLEDLCPDEATEANAVLVDDKPRSTDADTDQLSVRRLYTNARPPTAPPRTLHLAISEL